MVRLASGWPPSTRRRWTSGTGPVQWRSERRRFNARVAAAAHGAIGNVDFQPGDEASPLIAMVQLSAGADPELAPLYEAMLSRETNRRRGDRDPIPAQTLELLGSAARCEGARLQTLSGSAEVDTAAAILAAADRIRYLTPRLHADMFAELRLPGDSVAGVWYRRPQPGAGSGGSGDARRSATIGRNGEPGGLARRNRPWRRHVRSGDRQLRARRDFRARPESDRLCPWWIGCRIGVDQSATARACRPTGFTGVSVCTRTMRISSELSPAFAEDLGELQYNFRKLADTEVGESQVLVLRFCRAPRPSVPSRRRGLHRASSPLS